jgi:hypothetical protein
MSFLAPWALLWLGSIPVLLWLWRLSSSRRQVRVPSLIPFERLLKRSPTRRARLVVSLLFWLQLAALLGLAAALARPLVFRRRNPPVLALLDTSASMGAHGALSRAKQALLAQLSRKRPGERWFLMATAPPAPLLAQPTSDGIALARAVQSAGVSHLGGDLATAAHIGAALLGAEPSAFVVATDEAKPAGWPQGRSRWISVGRPSPNVALVGLDAAGPLCHPAEARLIATVHNFSQDAAEVAVVASADGRRLAEAQVTLAPNARQAVPLPLPPEADGIVEVALDASGDVLAADNRAWASARSAPALPIVVVSKAPAFRQALSAWLGACEALRWTVADAAPPEPAAVVTDEERLAASAAASLVFYPPPSTRPTPAHWVVSAAHPIGAYLPPVEAVASSLNLASAGGRSGTAVVSAVTRGLNVPIVLAEERERGRRVAIRLDPSGSRQSAPVILAFFNSLRWLLGRAEMQTTAEPLVVPGATAGAARVRRPDGRVDTVAARGGALVYEDAVLAGVYRIEQGADTVEVAVNFFDPLESNLLAAASTWRDPRSGQPASVGGPGPEAPKSPQPLSNPLVLGTLALLLVEWWAYSRKAR